MSGFSERQHTANCPPINISGSARAIIGNVYLNSSELPFFDVKRKDRKVSLLTSLPDRTRRNSEHLVRVTSELSVLLLRDFEDVKKSLYGFRKIEDKLGKYTKEVNVGRTIFQNVLLTLLSSHTGREQAQAMLSSQDNPLWLDESLADYMHELFGTDTEAVYDVLELISADLDAFASFSRKCFEFNDRSQNAKLSAFKEIKSKLKSTIVCLMHEHNLAGHLQSLSRHTNAFRALLDQYTRPQQRSSSISKPSEQARLKIGRYKRIQEAATNFYNAFGLACANYENHQGHLKLLADRVTPSRVQFTFLLEQSGFLTSSPKIMPPLRLTIESQVTGTLTDLNTFAPDILQSSAFQRKRSRDFDSSAASVQDVRLKRMIPNRKKVVGFVDQPLTALSTQDASVDEFPNFCINNNLCTHLRTILQQGGLNDMPLGYLDSHGCSKHLIYLASRTKTINLSPDGHDSVTSFKALYSRTDRRLSRPEKIALAVLQYQATPFWLQETWNSDNILVECNRATPMKIESDIHGHNDFDAYLHISIHKPDERKDVSFDSCSRTHVRNLSLFSFGLMLLELAYKTPIREMQTSHDIDPTGNVYNTNYFTATRIQPNVSAEMGPVYAEIVRQCLQCDFGHGSDLGATRLQEEFYEDVIQKLEDLEVKCRELGL